MALPSGSGATSGSDWTDDEWQHVLIINKHGTGDCSVECKHCEHSFRGGATRIRGHLLRSPLAGTKACGKCPEEVRKLMQAKEESKKSAADKKRKREEEQQRIADYARLKADGERQAKIAKDGTLQHYSKAAVHDAIADYVFSSAAPLSSAENPYFKRMADALAGYKPPTRHELSGDLLQRAKERIGARADASYVTEARKFGCIVMGDGWSDTCNRPLHNILVASAKGPFFLDAIDTSGKEKNAEYIAGLFIDAIEKFGPENVVGVCTDSASSCKSAGEIIEAKYPHITWLPCGAHCLDLCLEDICKDVLFKRLILEGKQIVNFMKNHHASQALVRVHAQLELLKPGETRFATAYIMLERLLSLKPSLQATVVDPAWDAWANKQTYRAEAGKVKELVLSSAFWEGADLLTDLLVPIYEVLRLLDSPLPVMGKVYHRCFAMQELVDEVLSKWPASGANKLDKASKTAIKAAVRARWDMLHTPLHAAAYALDPEYWDHDIDSNKEVMDGLTKVCQKLLPRDKAALAAGAEFSQFRNRDGELSAAMYVDTAKEMPAHRWWQQRGNSMPNLRQVAMRVLAQVASAGGCERNWSAYDFVHSLRRNRLTPERAKDLVWVYSNLRLVDRLQEVDGKLRFVPFEASDEMGAEDLAG